MTDAQVGRDARRNSPFPQLGVLSVFAVSLAMLAHDAHSNVGTNRRAGKRRASRHNGVRRGTAALRTRASRREALRFPALRMLRHNVGIGENAHLVGGARSTNTNIKHVLF